MYLETAPSLSSAESPLCTETILNLCDRHACTARSPKSTQAGELLTHTDLTQRLGGRPEPNFSIRIGTDCSYIEFLPQRAYRLADQYIFLVLDEFKGWGMPDVPRVSD